MPTSKDVQRELCRRECAQRLDELTKQLESAADDKPTSELAEIVDPYFIEVSSEEAADKLKSSGIEGKRRSLYR